MIFVLIRTKGFRIHCIKSYIKLFRLLTSTQQYTTNFEKKSPCLNFKSYFSCQFVHSSNYKLNVDFVLRGMIAIIMRHLYSRCKVFIRSSKVKSQMSTIKMRERVLKNQFSLSKYFKTARCCDEFQIFSIIAFSRKKNCTYLLFFFVMFFFSNWSNGRILY